MPCDLPAAADATDLSFVKAYLNLIGLIFSVSDWVHGGGNIHTAIM
jgi:hypothetical protein